MTIGSECWELVLAESLCGAGIWILVRPIELMDLHRFPCKVLPQERTSKDDILCHRQNTCLSVFLGLTLEQIESIY